MIVFVCFVLFAFFFSLCWAYISGWYSPLCPVIMFIKLCLLACSAGEHSGGKLEWWRHREGGGYCGIDVQCDRHSITASHVVSPLCSRFQTRPSLQTQTWVCFSVMKYHVQIRDVRKWLLSFHSFPFPSAQSHSH